MSDFDEIITTSVDDILRYLDVENSASLDKMQVMHVAYIVN